MSLEVSDCMRYSCWHPDWGYALQTSEILNLRILIGIRIVLPLSNKKTKRKIELPLIADVGNAIVDYLKNERETEKKITSCLSLSNHRLSRSQEIPFIMVFKRLYANHKCASRSDTMEYIPCDTL